MCCAPTLIPPTSLSSASLPVGRVKVKFVMMGQDEDQEEGEEGEDFVDQVIRSLPDDTTSLVSNHLKDVLV